MFWQEYSWSQNNESELSIPARFTVEMSARLKVKKDSLEYKNYFFLLNKNEVKKRSFNRGTQKEFQSTQKNTHS